MVSFVPRACAAQSTFAFEDRIIVLMTTNPPSQVVRQTPTEQGLSTREADRRLRQFGPNEIATGDRFKLLRAGVAFSSNPLVIILLVASAISGVLGEALNATLIALMVVLSVGLNFVQVYRSEQAARKLRSMVAPTASVWRNNLLA